MGHIKSTFAISCLLSTVTLVFEGATNAQTTWQVAFEKLPAATPSQSHVERVSVPGSEPSEPEESSSSTGSNASAQPDRAVDGASPEATSPKPLPIRVQGKPNELERAYLDAFSILVEETGCSSFLGGSGSIAALNELVKQLKPTYLSESVVVRMTGPITNYQSNLTGVSFRLFNKAEINLDGSFYRSRSSFTPRVPWVGEFPPNTRQARVTVLLHELGHLVQGADKLWVLPDDGNDPSLSRQNTKRILETCGKRIEAITKRPLRATD